MSDTKTYPKCIYVSSGVPCDEDAVYDGMCATHVAGVEEGSTLLQGIIALLVEFNGVDSEKIIATEIMNRLVGPVLDNHHLADIARVKTLNIQGEIQRQRTLESLKARKDLRKAKKTINSLREDFAELATDMRKVAEELETAPNPYNLLASEVYAWSSTARVASRGELYDVLTSKTNSGDFGPVPRPEAQDESLPKACSCWTRKYDSISCPLHGDQVK